MQQIRYIYIYLYIYINGHKWSTTHRVLKSHRCKMSIIYIYIYIYMYIYIYIYKIWNKKQYINNKLQQHNTKHIRMFLTYHLETRTCEPCWTLRNVLWHPTFRLTSIYWIHLNILNKFWEIEICLVHTG